MILALVPAGKPRITVLIIVLRIAKKDPQRIERKHPMLFNSPQEGCYVLHGYSRVQILEIMAQSEFVFHGDWAGLLFLLGVKYTICVGTSSTETNLIMRTNLLFPNLFENSGFHCIQVHTPVLIK